MAGSRNDDGDLRRSPDETVGQRLGGHIRIRSRSSKRQQISLGDSFVSNGREHWSTVHFHDGNSETLESAAWRRVIIDRANRDRDGAGRLEFIGRPGKDTG